VINTAISLYYYSKLIIATYTGKASMRRIRAGIPVMAVVVFCLLVIIVFGIYPQPVIAAAQSAASYLFR